MEYLKNTEFYGSNSMSENLNWENLMSVLNDERMKFLIKEKKMQEEKQESLKTIEFFQNQIETIKKENDELESILSKAKQDLNYKLSLNLKKDKKPFYQQKALSDLGSVNKLLITSHRDRRTNNESAESGSLLAKFCSKIGVINVNTTNQKNDSTLINEISQYHSNNSTKNNMSKKYLENFSSLKNFDQKNINQLKEPSNKILTSNNYVSIENNLNKTKISSKTPSSISNLNNPFVH